MAIRPSDRYPGQTEPPDNRYPYGSARNQTVLGDGTGFPWEKDVPNDILGFLQALLVEGGVDPSGAPDEVGASQYLQATVRIMDERARHLAAINWDIASIANFGGGDPFNGSAGVFVAPYSQGQPYQQEAFYAFESSRVLRSFDGHNWADLGPHGTPGGANRRGLAVGLMPNGTQTALVAWNASANGQIRASVDDGSIWADAGTLASSFDAVATFGGSFNGRFFISALGRVYYSDDLSSNTEWPNIIVPGWTGAPPPAAACFASAAGVGCAFGLNQGGVVHSEDGATWAKLALPTAPSDGVHALKWSASHNRWIALCRSGGARLFTAPAGFGVWTEIPVPSVWSSPRAIACLGKTTVVASNDALWVSEDIEGWSVLPIARLTPTTGPGISYPEEWEMLAVANGRIWAGRRHRIGGLLVFEQTRSLRYTAAPTLYFGSGSS